MQWVWFGSGEKWTCRCPVITGRVTGAGRDSQGENMHKIEIFTGPNCGYCEAAKALMREKGLAFDEIDLAASTDNMDAFRTRLPRVKSIPQIFVDGDHIGGLEDLRLHIADGRLGG